VGATVIVLGAQGEPGFPKFSDTEGWATVLTISAAITQTPARAINFLFVICLKSSNSRWLIVRFVPTNGNCKLTRSLKSSPPSSPQSNYWGLGDVTVERGRLRLWAAVNCWAR